MKRFILLICLFVSTLAHAQNSTSVVPNEAKIKAQYDKEQYTQAIEGYRELLLASKATPSAALYYNLGNAYYRNGELGWAILSYERTAQPTDCHKPNQRPSGVLYLLFAKRMALYLLCPTAHGMDGDFTLPFYPLGSCHPRFHFHAKEGDTAGSVLYKFGKSFAIYFLRIRDPKPYTQLSGWKRSHRHRGTSCCQKCSFGGCDYPICAARGK